jgi:adenylate kinase
MNIVLLGPPGSGKGTQAKLLEQQRGMKQLSTGDMLRDAAARGTTYGLKAKSAMDRGELVSDAIVVAIIADRLEEPDRERGFVLDGFPRNIAQADALDRMLASKELPLDAVIEIKVDDEALIRRLAGRYNCAKCGKGYHQEFERPKKDGVCDRCGSTEFVRRTDDSPETVRDRLKVYNSQTAPLVDHYRAKGVLRTIDGMEDINAVSRQIASVLNGRQHASQGRQGGLAHEGKAG